MAGFLDDAAFFLWQEGVEGVFRQVVIVLYKVVYVLVPKFSKYDGASLLVDGRNVTLRWVISAVTHLVLLGTSIVLMTACLIFQRREVAEVSV